MRKKEKPIIEWKLKGPVIRTPQNVAKKKKRRKFFKFRFS